MLSFSLLYSVLDQYDFPFKWYFVKYMNVFLQSYLVYFRKNYLCLVCALQIWHLGRILTIFTLISMHQAKTRAFGSESRDLNL